MVEKDNRFNEDEFRQSALLIEQRLKAWEETRKVAGWKDDDQQLQALEKDIEWVKTFGLSLELNYKSFNTPEKMIANLRFQLERKQNLAKFDKADKKKLRQRQGRLGKRGTSSGLVDVLIGRRKFKCIDIGVGEKPEGTEVIAHVPSDRSKTGFVDYKG